MIHAHTFSPRSSLSAGLALVLLCAAPACTKKEEPAATSATTPASPAAAKEQAPALFTVRFSTTKGDFDVEVHRDWAPIGADRFYNLVKLGFYKDIAFFRAISGFMVQFGIHGDPAVAGQWRNATIQDDPMAGQSNKRGFITFAKGGPNSRTTQVFINYADNGRLDPMGFPPFGQVVKGMEVVDSLHQGYGEGAPSGRGPMQMKVQTEGNAYLKRDFPELDYIKSATLL